MVITLPISTTNMTGLRYERPRGELDERVDGRAADEAGVERRPSASLLLARLDDIGKACFRHRCSLEELAGMHEQLLEDGSERVDREERERSDDHDHADEQADEQRAVVGNVPEESGATFFWAIEPAMPRTGMMKKKRPTNIPMASAIV